MAAPVAPPPAAPLLDRSCWTAAHYDRDALPVRVLQFGTGMLLRALVTAAIDVANQAGRRAGRVAIVQSTTSGLADTLAQQDGLYTVVERGLIDGRVHDDARLIGAVGPLLVADTQWDEIETIAGSATLRVVVSNVTEAGFVLPATDLERLRAGARPAHLPARLAQLLAVRARRLGDGAPMLVVIPTELVDDNGAHLRRMLAEAYAAIDPSGRLADWATRHVLVAASLVDRITTGAPAVSERERLEQRLGYRDAALTVTEPYALWAIEGEPASLRDALPIDEGDRIVFAHDIRPWRDRKLRLLNGLHTAMAPVALLAGIDTVADAVAHPVVGPFMHRLLFDELVALAPIAHADAVAFAHQVWDRFANPWLAHPWRTIAGHQVAKVRHRLAPAMDAAERHARPTPHLWVAVGAFVSWALQHASPDADLRRLAEHLRRAPSLDAGLAAVFSDATLWGGPLSISSARRATIGNVIDRLAAGVPLAQLLAADPS